MKKEFTIVVEEKRGRYYVTEADPSLTVIKDVVGFNRTRQEDLEETVREILPARAALRITNKIS